MSIEVNDALEFYEADLKVELANILDYWLKYSGDSIYGGFIGRVDNNNIRDYSAPKGAVLNARILWSFSAAYNLNPRAEYLDIATRSFNYIVEHFLDKQYGGVYWTVTPLGVPLETKKQVYAIAFAIYAFSEYFKASKNEAAKQNATELFSVLTSKAFDGEKGGYFEAFTADWQPIADLRLSSKDANEKKTMNTHLHILEAYTTLYGIWNDGALEDHIRRLIQNFLDHIVDKKGHLILFFDENWNKKSNTISYGHDIEAAWLLLEAAEAIGDRQLIDKVKDVSIKLSHGACEGLAKNGGMHYEYEPENQHLITEKHWWVQAEAMVGFFNAYQLTQEDHFLEKSIGVWLYTSHNILDSKNGEWFWGVSDDGRVMADQDKIGHWKCPYHNSRACIEIIRRVEFATANVQCSN
jgi:cellobiose epimerase